MGYLRSVAENELELFQKYMDGECYWYETEERVDYTKTYADGRVVQCHEYKDGEDSCGGFYIDKVDDIGFPRGDDWVVAADSDCRFFVGDEYDIPEWVVKKVTHEKFPVYLQSVGEKYDDDVWTEDIEKAMTMWSHGGAQCMAQKALQPEEYDYKKSIVEKDAEKKERTHDSK